MLISHNYILTVILFFFTSLTAQANNVEVIAMIAELNEKQSNPELKKLAIIRGKERALLCNQCHGDDGNSNKQDIPNLAAQNPLYLLRQIEKFSDGRRKNFVMNALSKNFSRDDKVNLAIFYASKKVNVTQSNTLLTKIGQGIYEKECSLCHGMSGTGQANFARLAGQKTQYVETTLTRYRDNSRDNIKLTKRNNIIMEKIASNLSDNDVKALAAYLAQLQ